MSDAKSDCQILTNAVLGDAELMLAAQGAFIPFGGAMRPSGEIVSIAGYTGDEHPKATDVISMLKGAFIAAARAGDYSATAIVYDVRVTVPSTQEKSDAIAVALDHQVNYSVVVYFPYRIEGGKPMLGAAFAQKGAGEIFPAV